MKSGKYFFKRTVRVFPVSIYDHIVHTVVYVFMFIFSLFSRSLINVKDEATT